MFKEDGSSPFSNERFRPQDGVRVEGDWYSHQGIMRRVAIQTILAGDADSVYTLLARNKDHFERFDPEWITRNFDSPQAVRSYLINPANSLRHLFTIRDAVDNPVGVCGLKRYETNTHMANVSYHVDQEHLNRGYASHALELLCAIAPSLTPSVVALVASIRIGNFASQATARKCGFDYWPQQNEIEFLQYGRFLRFA